MKNFVLGFWALFVSFGIYAQSNLLSIDDAVMGIYRKMYSSQLMDVAWKGNTTFTYSKKGILYQQDMKKGKEQAVFASDELFKMTKDSSFFDMMMFPKYSWENENILWISNDSKIAQIDVKGKKLLNYIVLPDTAENVDLCPKSKYAAFTIKNNLWVQDATNKAFAISNESNTGIVYGKSVHRDEFGIVKGTFWSPTGKHLAFYRMDESMVTEYPVVDITTRIATLKPIRYPMAGMKSHEVTVGVFDIDSKKIVYLKTGEPKEQFLTNIAWSPDDKYIFIAVLNRDQDHMKMNMYNAQTGDFVKTLWQ